MSYLSSFTADSTSGSHNKCYATYTDSKGLQAGCLTTQAERVCSSQANGAGLQYAEGGAGTGTRPGGDALLVFPCNTRGKK